jgi:hypothetical protein
MEIHGQNEFLEILGYNFRYRNKIKIQTILFVL